MKVTRKLKEEIDHFMRKYWQTYFSGDLDAWAEFLPDEYRNIGTTNEELWNSKQEILNYTYSVYDQMIGMAEMRHRKIDIIPYEDYFMVHELADLYVKSDDAWSFYAPLRLSSLLEKKDARWLVLHQHGSYPDSRTEEGEAFALDVLKAENKKLIAAVEKRTRQLEAKNKELEIESSMERVRAVAMGMKEARDLLGICEVLFNELEGLGFKALRNTMVNLNRDEASLLHNYDYNLKSGGEITEIPYDSHPATKNIVKRLKSSANAFGQFSLTGKKLEEWRDYRKKLGEKDDPQLKKTKKLSYYFYSIGTGSIGISTYEPIAKDKLAILERFRNVFELAYRRFIDIQQAEEQAREAKIEAALEKVRARTMAMQHSSELPEAANLLFLEVQALGIPAWSCGYNILAEDKNSSMCWMSSEGQVQSGFNLPFTNTGEKSFPQWEKAIKNKLPFLEQELGGKDIEEHYNYMRSLPELEPILKELDEAGLALPTYQINHLSFFKGGFLLFITYEKVPEAHAIFKRFAKVFDQTYTRFLDLQKAEEQTREAQIEASLERIRAKSMAMHKSEELSALSTELVKQVQILGKATWFCAFNIYDDDPKGSIEWGSNGENTFARYRTPREGIFNRYYKAGQKGESFLVNEIGPKNCPAHYEYLCTLPGVGEQLLGMKAAGIPFPKQQIDHVAYFEYGYILFITYEPAPELHEIFQRFAQVFEQSYRRFLDLQKAEAQAREAQIEAGLERVRSRSMAMHQSVELQKVIQVIFNQLSSLGLSIDSAQFDIFEEGSNDINGWIATPEYQYAELIRTPYFKSPLMDRYQKAKAKKPTTYTMSFSKAEKDNYWRYVFKNTDLSKIPTKRKKYLLSSKGLDQTGAILEDLSLSINNYQGKPYLKDDTLIIKRFAEVFQQAFTRFLDLQKAEAQAREAQIEASLERVRAQTMAMHRSDELRSVIRVIFNELANLDINAEHAGIVVDFKAKQNWSFWVAENQDIPAKISVPYLNSTWDRQYTQAKKKGTEFFTTRLDFEKKNLFYKNLLPHIKGLTTKARNFYFKCPGLAISTVIQEDIGLYIENFEGNPYTDEENNILLRFGQVIQQTYTRFLDLQRAEVQAREAQIETALEKVRSASLAMHKTSELQEVINTVHRQFTELEVDITGGAFIAINSEMAKEITCWGAGGTANYVEQVQIPVLNRAIYTNLIKKIKQGPGFFTEKYTERQKFEFFEHMFINPPYNRASAKHKKEVLYRKGGYHRSCFVSDLTSVFIINHHGREFSDEDNRILQRMGTVFEQSYTRFLDLQKAEAQAREAQIEASLERVRAIAMAMHTSENLLKTINEFFVQLKILDIVPVRCGVAQMIEDPPSWTGALTTATSQGKSVQLTGLVDKLNHPVLKGIYKNWQKQKSYFPVLKGKSITSYYRVLKPQFKLPKFPRGDVHYGHYFYFKEGCVFAWTSEPLSTAEIEIFERFSTVLSLTYRRYLDLKESETQAREAQIEAALERVRAKALAMHKPEELRQVADVLRKEMGALGIEELETSSIFINDEATPYTECWFAIKDIRSARKKRITDYFKLDLEDTWVGREMLKFYNSSKDRASIVMRGKNRLEWISYCEEQSNILKGYYGKEIPDRTYHLHKFSYGAIGAATEGEISEESWNLLKRTASVLTLAYSRFKDLTQARLDLQKLKAEKKRAEAALADLKSTQSQLIHAEKMASLGELTAGIAHEIQNPLNFVNNFSELNKELVEELKEELEHGDIDEVKAIASDIINNEEKISHHGRRAEGIVKGMLQHSRTSAGEKEETDINELADEYLRLSFHGLRAKDKSFNADFKLDLDENLPKVNVVPQDIGRVLLNLINNAFYAVREIDNPVVTVKTEGFPPVEAEPKGVKICVSDNGPGISEEIKDKIFQPFFTTKATGEGTGLGLSLSYDIVTKGHGGELRVESNKGKGCKFIISLNLS